jgi:predicted nucleotidyltransferase
MTLIHQKINNLKEIFERNDVVYAGLFGSYAKDSAREDSDIDILIDYGSNEKTLLEFIDLKLDLEEALNKKVDLVTKKALNSHLKKEILESTINIYERP